MKFNTFRPYVVCYVAFLSLGKMPAVCLPRHCVSRQPLWVSYAVH